MSAEISITRTRTGLGHPETAGLVKKAIQTTLEAEGIDVLCYVDVMLTDEDTIHEINLENRGVDRPTDVLSFPLNELKPGEFDEDECEIDMDTGGVLLGDMVISIPQCERQGEEYGHGYRREVCYLAVHSTLHLLGYDHMDEGEEKKLMRSREDAVMELLKITR
jgi:probable rRNA maturation factor